MLVHSSPIFVDQASVIAEFSREFRLPSIGLFPIYAKVGGFISYGPNNFDLIKQAGGIAGKDSARGKSGGNTRSKDRSTCRF